MSGGGAEKSWLHALSRQELQRSPNILLIPGTSSVAHLRENLDAAKLEIPGELLASLDALGR